MIAANRKLWPYVLAAILVITALNAVPSINGRLLRIDEIISRTGNSLVGKGVILDKLLIFLNTRGTDSVIIAVFGTFCLLQSLVAPSREEVVSRLAFWGWVAFVLVLCYLVQEGLEEGFERRSPGKALSGWLNLADMYHTHVKTGSVRSFPSGHATGLLLVGLMTLPRYWRIGLTLLALAAFGSTTRVIIGAHWSTDIVLGSLPLTALFAALAYETRLRRIENALARAIDPILAWRPLNSLTLQANSFLRAIWNDEKLEAQAKKEDQP